MWTLEATSNCYGKSNQYVARITGRHSKWTFEREFIGRKSGRQNDTTSADVDEDGLYEVCHVDKRGTKDSSYYVILDCPTLEILPGKEGTLRKMPVAKEDAMAIAKAFDAGRRMDQIVSISVEPSAQTGQPRYVYELLSAGEAKKAQAAATIESATEACWQAIQALPAPQAKKVLAALKARLAPPKAEPAAQTQTTESADGSA